MVAVAWSAGRLFAALFLVALNGFFVASEFALVRIRSTAVDQMVEEGRPGAGTLQEAVGSLDDYLAATQLGITVASLGLGWIGEPAVAALIEPVLAPVLPAGTLHLVAVGIGFSVVTFLHVVFGELAPKTFAIAEAEKIALLIAPPLKLFYYVFYPGLVVFNGAANWFTGLVGVPPASETEETLSEQEILMVLSTAGSAGTVTGDEVEMIEQVFELDDTTVQDVMVPRPNVVTIPADMGFAAARSLVADHGHTRYPVVADDGEEEIVGYVDAKDLLEASAEDTEGLTIAELAREVPLVPETLAVDDLLSLFQDEHTQFAVVIDEWGTLEGIVTVEDTVELVVGDIQDTFDTKAPEPTIREDGEDAYVADGACSIQRVSDALGTAFDTSYGTIGGLTLGRLGGSPSVGETVTVGGYRIDVTAVDGARIETVRLTPVPEDESVDGDESESVDGDGTDAA